MRRITQSPVFEVRRREGLLVKLERLTELPLLVLAIATIPLLVGPFFWQLSTAQVATFAALNSLIWAVFAVVFTSKLMIAPHKKEFLKQNWLELLIVVIPFARPLRLVSIALYGSRAFAGTRRLANLDFLMIYAIGLIVVSATIVTTVEVGADGANITSFPDALWWAVVTITTVGYGDRFPVTEAGRAIAVVLMMGGIGFFSGLTANLASFFIRGEDSSREEMKHLIAEVQRLNDQVARISQE